MSGNLELIIPILVPFLGGIAVLLMKRFNRTRLIRTVFLFVLAVSVLATFVNVFRGELTLSLYNFTPEMQIMLKLDSVGILFSVLTGLIWLLTGIYSCEYFKHEQKENQFFASYLMTYAVIMGIDYAGNLVTFYLFYELMTFITLVFVIHSRKREAISVTVKYLMYSLFGAFLALITIFYISGNAETMNFTAGGVAFNSMVDKDVLLAMAFVCIVGFGTKAGMFPLHGWLPEAHPVAPAPASAVLSGLITKAGVIAIIRVVYYIFGAEMLRGTWVQYTFMGLALATVLMGSVMAYRQNNLKRRLAYSTVSQVSYILFGLSLLNPTALTGAFLHIIFHAMIKVTLFLAAGAIIYKTGYHDVSEMRGVGKQMPITLGCFAVVSVGLVGIPPMNGFISKWYLATGAVETNIDVFSWLGPVILLCSAIFTAVYLFTMVVDGFSSGSEIQKNEASLTMTVPMIILASLCIICGLYVNPIFEFIGGITSAVLM